MSYEYTLPTTGAFYFSSCLEEVTGGSILDLASQYRARLRDTLKRLKRSEYKDFPGVIRCVEDYKPVLAQIYHGLNKVDSTEYADVPRFTEKSTIVTNWRATFHDHRMPGKEQSRVDVCGIGGEIQFVLLTYAYALSNYALLASHDPQRIVSLLCQAAGVFAFVNGNHLAQSSSGKMCPELHPELSACLERMTLGEAQLQALTQLQAKASKSMLCRIAVGASDHFSSAIGILGSHPMLKAIPNDFRHHLARRRDFALSKAYLHLALEQEKLGQVGFGLACAQLAERLHKNEETITLLRVLTKQNAQVTFQPVPSPEEVQAKRPSGRDFVKATAFIFAAASREKTGQEDQYAGSGAYY